MDMFSALADPTRRHILETLAAKGKLPASTLFKQFPSSPPAISQHLKVLREADLVLVEKKAQLRLYSVNPQKLSELERWIQQMKRVWNERFDRLEQVLEEEKKKGGGK